MKWYHILLIFILSILIVVALLWLFLISNSFYYFIKYTNQPTKIDSYDTLIVLGGASMDSKVELTKELYSDLSKKPIVILSGYGMGCGNKSETEAIYMFKELEKDINKSNMIKEENSRDSIGNALFSKKECEKIGCKNILIITTKDNLKRTSLIFDYIFKKEEGYNLRFESVRDEKPTGCILKIKRWVMGYIWTPYFFTKFGDLEDKLKKYHPYYISKNIKKGECKSYEFIWRIILPPW